MRRCVLNGAQAMALPVIVWSFAKGAWLAYDVCEACYYALRALRESKGLAYALAILAMATWARPAVERFVAQRPYRALVRVPGNSAAPGMATRGRASLGTAQAPPHGTAKATRGHRQPPRPGQAGLTPPGGPLAASATTTKPGRST